MIRKNELFPIGIGAWGIGGFAEKDPNNNDQKQIRALAYSLKRGMNFIEINFWNSQGKSVELIADAIKTSKIPRKELFLTLVIYSYNLPTLKDVKYEINKYFELFETDCMDTLEFTLPNFPVYGFKESANFIEGYLAKSKARFTSLTNSNLDYLKKFHKIFKDKVFSHEMHFSFEVRVNEDLGITSYAQENGILNVPYQPLRRNRTAKRNWPLLVELAKKYGKTQNQIILNWLNWKKFVPLVKSEDKEHIDENLDALNFAMESEDYKKIDTFRVPGYKTREIDWFQEGKRGEKIHMLPNIIDDILDGK